jgi:hypothetical protein
VFTVLAVASAALGVQVATDPEPDDFAREDIVQSAALAAGFAVLVLLAIWGAVHAARGYGSWKLVAAGVVAAVGGAGYTVVFARELSDGAPADDTVLALLVCAVATVLGALLVRDAYPSATRRSR